MIELKAVSKTLGGKPVLTDVSLHVPRGETLVIVGASGAGKSVTLKHVVGLMRPDSGEVLVNGQPVHTARGRQLASIRNTIGVLFQSGALVNWMNVFDNVALPLREKAATSEAEIAEISHHALSMVGLDNVSSKMPSELSGGMRKRAGLARAIVNRPEIILYDEPTSGLDPVLSRSIDELIRTLQDTLKTTAIVVTHDLRSAFAVGDAIAMISGGTVIEYGRRRAFADSANPTVQAFITAQFGNAPPKIDDATER